MQAANGATYETQPGQPDQPDQRDQPDRVRPRSSLPVLSFNLWAALGATALAGTGYVLALSAARLPAPAFSVILYTLAPVGALTALVVIWARRRAEGDPGLAWVAVGLAVACTAMVLQLIALPLVAVGGGPLGTGGEGTAQLYLTFHLWIYGCCLAAVARVPQRARGYVLALGLLASLGQAVNAFPSPDLITERQVFTPLLVVIEWVLTGIGAVAVLGWTRTSGRFPTPLRGWVGVCLLLSTYEVALNALAGRRFDALWWSSLSLRAAGFAALAVGCLGYLLRQATRIERYSAAELGLRERELRGSVMVTDRLLVHARELARSQTPQEVARTLAVTARLLGRCDRATVWQLNLERRGMELLTVVPDPVGAPDGSVLPELDGLPDPETSLYRETAGQLAERGSGAVRVGSLRAGTGVEAVAALPLRVGSLCVGALVLESARPRPWPAADRELLQGLADQAGPVLSRARLASREHEAAQTLQRSLLPDQLPTPDGLSLTAHYQPAVREDRVGGDWYDSWVLADGRVALVVGDVVGKGLAAAATSGRLRASMRALAVADPAPGSVLTRLDQLESDTRPGMVATVVYALFDAGLSRVRIAAAGHPPAILSSPGVGSVLLDSARGTPIGLAAGPLPEVDVEVPPGAVLVLYTDGLVEDRRHPIDERLVALLDAVTSGLEAGGAAELPARLVAGYRSRDDDDVAVLVAQRTVPGGQV